MNRKAKQEPVHFDGKFNEDIRKQIQVKRLQLGLAYQRIANLFSANWSTIRKWETGPTVTCSVALRPKVEAFLNGEYDKMIQEQQGDLLTGCYPQSLPDCALRCMEKFSHAYQLLRYRPDLRNAMLENIEKVTRETLHRLISTECKAKNERLPIYKSEQ